MDLLSNPRIGKFVTASLAVLLLVIIALVLAVGSALYGAMASGPARKPLGPQDIPGNASLVDLSGPGIKPRQGIFFPGQTAAPTVILAHGYRSGRDDMLTLAIALQENKFNVFLFDFSGHGEVQGTITFGYKETRELLAAIESVAQRPDVDQTRFGIYGMDMGGYAALAAANGDPQRVRAVAVNSSYGSPVEMLRLQIERSGLRAIPGIGTLGAWGFKLMTLAYRNDPKVADSVASLACPKLFIQSRDRPALAEQTLTLFQSSTGMREQAVISTSDFSGMTEQEKREYELRIVNFFLTSLPPVPPKPAS